VQRASMRQQHARAELSDLQLLHVTKELQVGGWGWRYIHQIAGCNGCRAS
jgi:hypothetical protein